MASRPDSRHFSIYHQDSRSTKSANKKKDAVVVKAKSGRKSRSGARTHPTTRSHSGTSAAAGLLGGQADTTDSAVELAEQREEGDREITAILESLQMPRWVPRPTREGALVALLRREHRVTHFECIIVRVYRTTYVYWDKLAGLCPGTDGCMDAKWHS